MSLITTTNLLTGKQDEDMLMRVFACACQWINCRIHLNWKACVLCQHESSSKNGNSVNSNNNKHAQVNNSTALALHNFALIHKFMAAFFWKYSITINATTRTSIDRNFRSSNDKQQTNNIHGIETESGRRTLWNLENYANDRLVELWIVVLQHSSSSGSHTTTTTTTKWQKWRAAESHNFA